MEKSILKIYGLAIGITCTLFWAYTFFMEMRGLTICWYEHIFIIALIEFVVAIVGVICLISMLPKHL